MIYAIDYNGFHPDCKDIQVIETAKGLLLHCRECRIIVDAQDRGVRVEPADASLPGRGTARKEFHR